MGREWGEEERRKERDAEERGRRSGLGKCWEERREGRAIREARGDKNEFLFHPQLNNPSKVER